MRIKRCRKVGNEMDISVTGCSANASGPLVSFSTGREGDGRTKNLTGV
jgi:hypothetical protein